MPLLTFTDAFTRSTINPGWTKGGAVTAGGYGDPAPLYVAPSALYVFADDLTTGAISVFTTTTSAPQALGSAATALALPADRLWVRDPHVKYFEGVYYMVYSHQPLVGAGVATMKIGIATSLTPAGPYTIVDDDIASLPADSVNEPFLLRRNGLWYLYCTTGTGTSDDIGREDIGVFVASVITGPYQFIGNVLPEGTTPLKWQDQHLFIRGGNVIMQLNDDVHGMRQTCSLDGHVWDTPSTEGQLALGSSGAIDDGGVFALHAVDELIGGQHIGYYQAWNGTAGGSNNVLALATCPTLHRWLMSDSTYWECTGTKLRKKSSSQSNWEDIRTECRFRPPYQTTFTINFESEDETGYTYGILVGAALGIHQLVQRRFYLIIDVSADTIALWDTTNPAATTFNQVNPITFSYNFSLATDYAFRITVSPYRLRVEINDGGGYDSVIDMPGFQFAPSHVGFMGFAFSSALNHFTVDNYSATELEPATPSRIFSKAV